MMRGFLLETINSILVCLLDEFKISKMGGNILDLHKDGQNSIEDSM